MASFWKTIWGLTKRGGEAIAEESFTSGLASMFKMLVNRPEVKDKVKSIFNDFLPNDVADEQLFNAAISDENVSIENLHTLLKRVSKLNDHQQNRFRILVAQYKVEGDRKGGDPKKTAQVLAKLSNMTDDDWKNYVKFMDLDKKRVDRQITGFFSSGKGKSFAVWMEKNQALITSWAEETGSPALRELADDLQRSRNTGFDWDPARHVTFWSRLKSALLNR